MNSFNENENTLIGLSNKIIESTSLKIENALPAKVIEVKNRNIVDVQPLIKKADSTGKTYQRQVIKNVPVLNSGSSKGCFSIPLSKGDLGWIIANDRDISGYLSTLKEATPATYRKHSFSDSFFIPARMQEIKVSDNESTFILTDDPNVLIQINKNEIKVKNNGAVLTLTGNEIKIDADSINLNGTIFTKDGVIKAKSIESDSVKAGGVEVADHTHTGTGYQGTPLIINGMGK